MRFRLALAIFVAVALSITGLSSPAQAADGVPTGCTNARQVGPTVKVRDSGWTLASVKLYRGRCNGATKKWAYVYIWKSLVDTNMDYRVTAAIIAPDASGPPTKGMRTGKRPRRQFFSFPIRAPGSCVSAVGVVRYLKSDGIWGSAQARTPAQC
ncbi:hypothetical protein [Nocardioides speluncae]|uniref:hypothetical protein n=1 Tax=Nocardioides speluncae TaxID=2670337 RepID=UPI0012B183AD|nr:hypothetical protein [Nocardioides speluncae]